MSLFELKKVVVGPETLCATVQLDAAAPVMTSDDIEGTQRVYDLMPQIADHACISEAGDVFRDALPNTEVAFSSPDGSSVDRGWRYNDSYFEMRDNLGMAYHV